MALGGDKRVKLNQCVFGYDEGHRLLAASQKLPNEAASLLLLHSDLVPGLPSTSFKSYWTGVPVFSLKAYALMHTWPAPEMSRPGCVWTHVLLISFADIARFSELRGLTAYFARPREGDSFVAYREPISAEPRSSRSFVSAPIRSNLLVLRALYSNEQAIILDGSENHIDEAIFSVWSQQWPRLRRSFSFRTARASSESASRVRFDIQLSGDSAFHGTRGNVSEQTEPWEEVALHDLLVGPTEFRKFLWRYGADQSRGRERFRFLAELYASTRSTPHLTKHKLWKTLEEVTEILPDQADGKLLKDDFLSAGRSSYSLLPTSNPLDILDFFAAGADRGAFPSLPEEAFDAIHEVWAEESDRILCIAERATRQESVVAAQLLKRLAAVAEPTSFLSLARAHPLVRSRLVEANPSLLDSPGVLQLDQTVRAELISFVRDQDLAGRVVARLLPVNDAEAANILTRRFPEVVEVRVLQAMTEWIAGDGPRVPLCWQDAVRLQNPSGLTGRLLHHATTTNALAACAVLLQFDLRAGLSVASTVWADTLIRAQDDAKGQSRQKLLTYLLSLALAAPARGCEPLFERSFEPVHSDLGASRLPHDSTQTLYMVLPDLFWWQQWDTCLRLRHGTVNAYVNANLDPPSFRRLTQDAGLFKRLVELADESKQGRRFLKHVA